MAPNEHISNISDAAHPNAGRIYDYLLGGNHNFEIDRQSADQLLAIVPQAKQLVRVIRWFLGEAVYRLLDEGYTRFIDFASGLPTEDHIHQIAPKGTKVIYSDIDPVTVAYAQEIIKDQPDVRYFECDVRTPEKLLSLSNVENLIGRDRKVALGLNGIAWFITDEELERCLNVLYDWADTGTKLFISVGDFSLSQDSELAKGSFSFYEKVGQPVFHRDEQTCMKLIGKWKLEEPGFIPLEDWIGIEELKKRTEEENLQPVNLLGGILSK
jgi:hypothetical protein